MYGEKYCNHICHFKLMFKIKFVRFVNFEKAFGKVDLRKLMSVFQNIGVDWWDSKLIWNLYKNQLLDIRWT